MAGFRRLFWLIALLYSAGLTGCRSTDHTAPADTGEAEAAPTPASSSALTDAKTAAAAPVAAEAAATKAPALPLGRAVNCNEPPDRICCEALTPACNDCRDKAVREKTDWAAACVKPGTPSTASAQAIGCLGAPPVSDCCAEPTAECRTCRSAAMARLMAWKEACGDVDQLPCDRQPVLSECCEALMPSCDQCRDRNKRLWDAWTKRCGDR